MTKILVVSQSLKFSRVLDYSLTHYGFTVEVASTFERAVQLIEEINFRTVLIDVAFCKDFLLKEISCPVIAMGECYEEVSILEKMYSGIDDYVLKPFGIPELRMVMNKQLERYQLRTKPLVVGDLKIDVARNIVTVKDKIISLGKKEFEIMIRLTKKAGKIVVADSLLTKHRIAALTKKLEQEVGNALEIRHISGLGYKLIAPAM
jgi:DNA-binding response OmpR family regulator